MGKPSNSGDGHQSFEEIEAILVLMETMVGELNQPLTVISGLSELLIAEHGPNSRFTADLLIVQRQTRRIKETLAGVKYITRYPPKLRSGRQHR